MSVTQYIGARYVPLFATPEQWISERAYEPLTIVLHEGNSYTSKQAVPIGIDIQNNEFWALTGNYNAQVEAYRREVQEFDGRITTLENTSLEFDGRITTLENTSLEFDGRITTLENTSLKTFETVAAMKTANLAAGDIVSTQGYYSYNDNGNNEYIINAAGVDDGGSCIALNNGLFAIATGNLEKVETWGADNTGAIDSAAAINNCIQHNKGKSVSFNGGTFVVSSPIITPYLDIEKVEIFGNGSTIKPNGTFNTSLPLIKLGYDGLVTTENVAGSAFSYVRDLKIDGNGVLNLALIIANGHKDVHIINCEFYNSINSIQICETNNARPADVQIDNCIIRGLGNANFGSGIIINGTDNKISNSRIYRHAPSIKANAGGNFINNVHALASRGETQEEQDAWYNTAFIDAAGSVFIDNCYADSMHRFVKGTGGFVSVTNSQFNTKFSGVSCKIFEFSGQPSLHITNNLFYIPDNADKDNTFGLRFTNYTQAVSTRENFTIEGNYVGMAAQYADYSNDLLFGNKGFVNSRFTLQPNTWYKIGSVMLLPITTRYQEYITEIMLGYGSNSNRVVIGTVPRENSISAKIIEKPENMSNYTLGLNISYSGDVPLLEIYIKSSTAQQTDTGIVRTSSPYVTIPGTSNATTQMPQYSGSMLTELPLT